MSQIIPFTYEGNNVRTLTTEDGELRFVLADLAAVLDITNVTQLRSRLSDDLCQTYPVPDRRGQVQQTWTVNEPGLYEVIIRSDKPEAVQFRRWVTSEVLPSIRKHGGYLTPEAVKQALRDPDFIIQLATDLKEEQAKRAQLQAQAKANAPKVQFANAVESADTDILIGDLAKILRGNGIDTGQKRLFEWMRENGYLIKQRGSSWNMPTQKAMDAELFRVKESVVTHADGHTTVHRTTKVTGRGQTYFVNKFLAN